MQESSLQSIKAHRTFASIQSQYERKTISLKRIRHQTIKRILKVPHHGPGLRRHKSSQILQKPNATKDKLVPE